jgi:hypothetical protein
LAIKLGTFLFDGNAFAVCQSGFERENFQFWKLNYLLGSLIVLAVVTAEEFSQIFIRGRTFDLSDLIFDYAGFLFSARRRVLFVGRLLQIRILTRKAPQVY